LRIRVARWTLFFFVLNLSFVGKEKLQKRYDFAAWVIQKIVVSANVFNPPFKARIGWLIHKEVNIGTFGFLTLNLLLSFFCFGSIAISKQSMFILLSFYLFDIRFCYAAQYVR